MKRGTWVLGVGALIAAGATAAPAGAVDNWGPTNAYYKNNLVATGSGYFSNDRGQYAANRIKVTDRRNDGKHRLRKDPVPVPGALQPELHGRDVVRRP